MFVHMNMNNMFEMYDATFEVYIEDKLVNRQAIKAPREMLMMNFMQTSDQAKNDNRPVKIQMIVPNTIWDKFENKEKVLNNRVEFINNAMIAWEENKKQKGVENESTEE